jgi:hypothetical protein
MFCCGESFAFRCGNGLVTTGDSKTKVRVTCGHPSSKETRCKNKWTTTTRSGKTKTVCDEKVDVWYYNCGENDFVYALTFDNNILISEDTEGRGRGSSECGGR